jgi:hypothetical protein
MKWPAMMFLMIGPLIATNPAEGDAGEKDHTVPDTLMPPKGQVMLFKVRAIGSQIYQCKAKADDPGQFIWALKAPDADLFDEDGRRIGRHYGGPTWESNDGSKVIGELIEKAPAPKDGDIPWLLLKGKAVGNDGIFSRVTHIQRVDTEGGNAPAERPDQSHQGQEVRVNYKATYIFYGARGR